MKKKGDKPEDWLFTMWNTPVVTREDVVGEMGEIGDGA